MTDEAIKMARECAASLRPFSHNSYLIEKGERDGTDIVQSALEMHRRMSAQSLADKAAITELVDELDMRIGAAYMAGWRDAFESINEVNHADTTNEGFAQYASETGLSTLIAKHGRAL